VPATPSPTRTRWLAPSARPYHRGWLRLDLVAGLAAGTVVIPQAMAYSTIAGLPVQIGLYTCMVPLAVYALLGGSRTLSVSTTSTIAILVASTLASSKLSDDAHATMRAAFTLAFLVGLCLLAMRLFRLGALVENVSPATMTGIKTGVGLTVAVGQLPSLLGVPGDSDASGFFSQLAAVIRHLGDADGRTVAVSAVSVAILVVLRKVAPSVPAPLVAVAAGILLVALTGVEDHGLALIPPVPTGLPSPVLPVAGDVIALLPGALAIAVMAFLETVLVARANRRRHEPQIDSNQELLAVGVASMLGGLTQTLPPAGGFSQSAVNLRAGARTQVAGLTTAVLAVLVALFLAPVLDDLPECVLAAMVVVATVGLVDLREFGRFARINRAELWVALVTAAIGLTAGLLLAVAVGVILTFVLLIGHLNRSAARPLYPRPGGGWTPNLPDDPQPTPEGVAVVHLDIGLYTGNALPTAEALVRLSEEADPPLRGLVVEASEVGTVSVSFIDTIRSVHEDLARDGVRLVLAGMPVAALDKARGSVWFAEQEQAGLVQPTVDEAIAQALRDQPA
jgi:SulP family sulfate permease